MRFSFAFALFLAAGCASTPVHHDVEVSVARVDSSRGRPAAEVIYEVVVANASAETIYLTHVDLQPGLGETTRYRGSSVSPNVWMEPGESRDYTIFAEPEERSATAAPPAWQVRVSVSYRVGSEDRSAVFDVMPKATRR